MAQLPHELSDIWTKYWDYEQYCRECLSVKDKTGRTIPMELYPAQRKLDETIAGIRAKGKPVRIVALKARRVMVSTGTAAKFFQEVAHIAGQEAVVIGHQATSTQNLFEMYQRFQENFRPIDGLLGLDPLKGPMTRQRIEWTNGSKITCKTAGSKDFARSFNFRYLHISEAAFIEDQAKFLIAAIQSVPDDKDTMIIVESTANGLGDEFYKLCMQAMEGKSDWVLFFFAWFEHPEYVRALDEKPHAFQATLDEEEQMLMRNYRLSLEQMNWRRWAIKNRCRGSVQSFKQEYPSNPHEAFLGTGRPRFDLKTIDRMPTIENPLIGRLEEANYAGQKMITFAPNEFGEFKIYRRPEKNRQYVAGADVAEGVDVTEESGEPDGDYCVLPILDRLTGEQVAVWRAQVHPSEFARNAWLALRYYNWAQLVPEANGPGLAFIDELLRQGYPTSLIYHRNEMPDGDPRKRAPAVGWKTTQVTRPQLISELDTALRDSSIIVYDPVAKQELRTFVIKANGRAEHQVGCHDDYVIGLGLVVIGIIQMTPVQRQQTIDQRKPQASNYLDRNVDRQSTRYFVNSGRRVQ